jgi:hypothetical protein
MAIPQQTSYSRSYSGRVAGQLSDSGDHRIESFLNDEGSAIPAGIGVALKSAGKAEEIDSAADNMLGISVFSFARNPNDLTGTDAIQNGDTFNVLVEGACFVAVEETVAVGDPVYVRVTSDGGSNTQLGKFRNDSDSGRCKLVKGARWLSAGSTSSPAELYFSAAAEQSKGDYVTVVIDHPQVTADTTTTEWAVPSDRSFILDKAQYYNATGLANHATDFFNVKVLAGATVMANWSTETGQEGTATADTVLNMTLAAESARVCAPGTAVKLFLDESGTATLPAGKVILHGRYL